MASICLQLALEQSTRCIQVIQRSMIHRLDTTTTPRACTSTQTETKWWHMPKTWVLSRLLQCRSHHQPMKTFILTRVKRNDNTGRCNRRKMRSAWASKLKMQVKVIIIQRISKQPSHLIHRIAEKCWCKTKVGWPRWTQIILITNLSAHSNSTKSFTSTTHLPWQKDSTTTLPNRWTCLLHKLQSQSFKQTNGAT